MTTVRCQNGQLCTVEGLFQSVSGWSTLVQIPLVAHAIRLNQTELFLQKAALKPLPPTPLNFNSKLFAQSKEKFVFTTTTNGGVKTLTYLLYNPSPENGSRAVGVQLDPSRADQRLYPLVALWSPSPLKIDEYCRSYHSLECSLTSSLLLPQVNTCLPTYWTPMNLTGVMCPNYCSNSSSFNNNIINFDLNLLYTVEDPVNSLMSGALSTVRMTITSLRNVTMIAPSLPFSDQLIASSPNPADSSVFGDAQVAMSPLINGHRKFTWGNPVRIIGNSNFNDTVMSLTLNKPLYVYGSPFGMASMTFRLSLISSQFEEFLPPRMGFCLMMTVSGYLVSGSQKAIQTVNPMSTPDFNLTSSPHPDLNRFTKKVIEGFYHNPNAFYSTPNTTEFLFNPEYTPYSVNFDDVISKPEKTFPSERVTIGNVVYVVSYVQLQVNPWFFMCFADEQELLYSGSHHLDKSLVATQLTFGQVSYLSIKLINDGKLNLTTSLTVSPSLSSPWLYLSNISSSSSSSSPDITVIRNQTDRATSSGYLLPDALSLTDQVVISNIAVNTWIEIWLMVDSSVMSQGALTEVGLVMTTSDSGSGWCYQKQESVKISVTVDWRIDDIVFVEWDSPMGILFSFFTSLFIFLILCLLIITIKMRNNSWFKAVNPLFVQMMMMGSLIGLSSVFFWIGEPNNMKCNGRVWFASIGFGLMFSTLLVKNYRIFKIMQNIATQNHTLVSEMSVLPFIVGCVVMEFIILIIWISVNPLTDKLIGNKSYLKNNQNEKICDGDNLLLWLLLLFIFNGSMLLIGCYLAFILRKVHDKLNESRLIGLSIYNITLTSCTVIPLELFADISSSVKLILIGIGTYSVFVVVIVALMIPLTWKTWLKPETAAVNHTLDMSTISKLSGGSSRFSSYQQ